MSIKALVFDAYGTLFDVQSVAAVTDAAFPGHGATITQIWRLKQLEYTWLRALMDRYEDFWTVTRDSLDFTLRTVPPRLAEQGDPHSTIDDVAHDLTPVLEWYERDERDHGLGDMPYPPDYPKMPGEPKRVQPSKDTDRKKDAAKQ